MNTIEQYNKVIEQCRSLFTNNWLIDKLFIPLPKNKNNNEKNNHTFCYNYNF